MKKITLTLSMILTSLLAFSQNNNFKKAPDPIEQSKYSIGVIGGFGNSFIMPYSNQVFRPSWDAGLSFIYAPRQHWGLGVDALYSSEGGNFTYTNYMNNTEYKIQSDLDYIRVPVKAIYFFREYEKDFRPKISLGPTLGVLVNEYNSANASTIDVGGSFSLGFNYRIARAVWINVDANYYQGFVDIYTNNSENDLNSNMRLNAGINFGF